MIQFTIGRVNVNTITNEIKINVEKNPSIAPYIHQACVTIDAKQALSLIDELKNALIQLTNTK